MSTNGLKNTPDEILLEIVEATWRLQLEHQPNSVPLIHCRRASDARSRSVYSHVSILKAMPLILVNKKFNGIVSGIVYEQTRIDGRIYSNDEAEDVEVLMERLLARIRNPGTCIVDSVRAVDLEINFKQPTSSIKSVVSVLALFPNLKHLRITNKLIARGPRIRKSWVLAFLCGGLDIWPGDSSALLEFFRLNLETLVLRFHHFYTVERPIVKDGEFQIFGKPMNSKTLPWGVADPDVADSTKKWYQEVFNKSQVYKAVGDGEEEFPEDTCGLPKIYKGIRYSFPKPKGTRLTKCPKWPIFSLK